MVTTDKTKKTPLIYKRCPECGNQFRTNPKRQATYCGSTCYQRSHKARITRRPTKYKETEEALKW